MTRFHFQSCIIPLKPSGKSSSRRCFLFRKEVEGWDGPGQDGKPGWGSEAESQLVCLKGQEWRSTASRNAVCSRVGLYTGGVESPHVRLVAYCRAGQGTHNWRILSCPPASGTTMTDQDCNETTTHTSVITHGHGRI